MKTATAAAIFAVLGITGCDDVLSSAAPGDGPITRVVKATQAACNYVPEEGTVEALLGALGGLQTVAATGVAGRICQGLEARKTEIFAALGACGNCAPPPPNYVEVVDPATGMVTLMEPFSFEVDGVQITGHEVIQ